MLRPPQALTIALAMAGLLITQPGSVRAAPVLKHAALPTASDSLTSSIYHAAAHAPAPEGNGGFYLDSLVDPDCLNSSPEETPNPVRATRLTVSSSGPGEESQLFQAKVNISNWSGTLLAFQAQEDSSPGPLLWSAAGGISTQERRIVTYDGIRGVPFEWTQLSRNQQRLLDGADGQGKARVAYLRGDTPSSLPDHVQFRERSGSLGPIIHSQPTQLGNEDFGFALLPEGRPDHASGGYHRYLRQRASDVVFVGTNAGMLHAFDARSGHELFAYVPAGVFPHLVEFTTPDAPHPYLMDGSPRLLDAYLHGQWRTILVAATGRGGRSVFALDVSHPRTFGPDNVLWEFTHPDLGLAISDPTIVRLGDAAETWAVAFGNGLQGAKQTAQLFLLDLATGELLPGSPIGTGAGGPGQPNGLSHIVPVDSTGGRVTDAIYGGDIQGNLWKFEPVTPQTPERAWRVAFNLAGTPTPLFQARDAAGNRQPITARPTVGRHPDGGVMVYAGTGIANDLSSWLGIDTRHRNSLYGIRDTGHPVLGPRDITLHGQTLETGSPSSDNVFRFASRTPVDYAVHHGWYLDLSEASGGLGQEQILTAPQLSVGRLTALSQAAVVDECVLDGISWLMELDPIHGGGTDDPVFVNGPNDPSDPDSPSEPNQGLPPSGYRITGIASGSFSPPLTSERTLFRLIGTLSGDIHVVDVTRPPPDVIRQSWRQLH